MWMQIVDEGMRQCAFYNTSMFWRAGEAFAQLKNVMIFSEKVRFQIECVAIHVIKSNLYSHTEVQVKTFACSTDCYQDE